MSQSRFLVLVGTGNAYTGNGLKPNWLFSFYDDKKVWNIISLVDNQQYLFQTDSIFKIDDLFLLTSLIVLKNCFNESFNEHKIFPFLKIKNNFIKKRKNILENDWLYLYNLNKNFISNTNVKFVCIFLDNSSICFGYKNLIPSKEELIKKFKEYQIKNYEICISIFSNFYGYFT